MPLPAPGALALVAFLKNVTPCLRFWERRGGAHPPAKSQRPPHPPHKPLPAPTGSIFNLKPDT